MYEAEALVLLKPTHQNRIGQGEMNLEESFQKAKEL